jgi:hypothetical protein
VETSAFRHGAANLASLGKIVHIVSDHYVGIKRVPALPTIAVGIVYAGFFLFAHATAADSFPSNNPTNSVRLQT